MDPNEPLVAAFYDKTTSSLSYLVADPASKHAIVIDPVLDFDMRSGRLSAVSLERVVEVASGKTVDWIVETHPHADHLTAAAFLRTRLGSKTAIGAGVTQVQQVWSQRFEFEPEFRCDGSQFDRLLHDGDVFDIGNLRATVLDTPGHTPACISLLVQGKSGRIHAFVGDVLFMPDSGTARTDFPGGSARDLYASIRKLLDLPGDTLIYTAHDYQPGGRELGYCASVAAHRATNIHVKDGIDVAAFVAMREARDATLETPNLLLPALQINIRGGELPPASASGARFLKLPLVPL